LCSRSRRCRGCGWCSGRAIGFHQQDQRAFGNLVAYLDLQFLDDTGMARRDFHAGLVGLDRDQRLINLDAVANLDQQLDDFHFLEVADIRDFDFHNTHSSGSMCPLRRTQWQQRIFFYCLVAAINASPPDRRQAQGNWLVCFAYSVTGFGLFGLMPYLVMASATTLAGIAPSSARDFNAATVT
jgi:hypothetical protein